MRRRAMGQETEYGCVIYAAGTYPDLTAPLSQLVKWTQLKPESQFYPNGHRVYVDIQSHLEIATGECDDPTELAHHVLAGDRNLAAWTAAFEEAKATQYPGEPLSLRFFKNNICGYGSSAGEQGFGAHENYQIAKSPRDYVSALAAYLATRQIVLGAGRLTLPFGSPVFELGQRSGFISMESGSGTTGTTKPLVNLRDEAHAIGSRRLHLISGDNSILPQQTALKFAIMDVLLAMIEERRLRPLYLLDSVAAVHQVSLEPTVPLVLRDGRSRTALAIQRHYFDQALRFVQKEPDMAHQLGYLLEWGRHLDRLGESYEAEHHVGELCWATKEWHLRRFLARNPQASLAELRRRELMFHQVTGEGSSVLAAVLKQYGRYDPAAVELARTTPPRTTRAWARGQVAGMPDAHVYDWTRFVMDGESYSLGDPLDPALPAAVSRRLAA